MTSDNLTSEAAEALYEARRSAKAIPPIAGTFGVSDADLAYQVQEQNTVRWLDEGRELVGRKIGLTSKVVQAQLGVDQPDYGMLWSDFSFQHGARVETSRLIQPRVEAEIAFIMERELSSANPTVEEVAAAIDYGVAAIEIVDSAIADWKISLADTIADNASGAGFVLGSTRLAVDDIDLVGCTMTLSRHGEVVSEGVGEACLGNPLNAVRWLAAKMCEVGRPLAAGDIVLSGALGPMVDAVAGDDFEVRISGFDPLQVSFV